MDLGLPPPFRRGGAGGFFLGQVSGSRGKEKRVGKRQRSPSCCPRWLGCYAGREREGKILQNRLDLLFRAAGRFHVRGLFVVSSCIDTLTRTGERRDRSGVGDVGADQDGGQWEKKGKRTPPGKAGGGLRALPGDGRAAGIPEIDPGLSPGRAGGLGSGRQDRAPKGIPGKGRFRRPAASLRGADQGGQERRLLAFSRGEEMRFGFVDEVGGADGEAGGTRG